MLCSLLAVDINGFLCNRVLLHSLLLTFLDRCFLVRCYYFSLVRCCLMFSGSLLHILPTRCLWFSASLLHILSTRCFLWFSGSLLLIFLVRCYLFFWFVVNYCSLFLTYFHVLCCLHDVICMFFIL